MLNYLRRLLGIEPPNTPPSPKRERVLVQLHCVGGDPTEQDRVLIVHSWEPIECQGWREARDVAFRLRQDNRWASAVSWPSVTVTGEDGVMHGDHVLSPWYDGKDKIDVE